MYKIVNCGCGNTAIVSAPMKLRVTALYCPTASVYWGRGKQKDPTESLM